MDRVAQQIAPKLDAAGINYQAIENGRLHIQLPHNFGVLEVGAVGDHDTIVGLVGQDWHTHGDVLKGYYFSRSPTEVDAIAALISAIFAGHLALVEEQWSGKTSRFICHELEQYLKNLPKGAEYKIFNK
jgi:hypothetical protein